MGNKVLRVLTGVLEKAVRTDSGYQGIRNLFHVCQGKEPANSQIKALKIVMDVTRWFLYSQEGRENFVSREDLIEILSVAIVMEEGFIKS